MSDDKKSKAAEKKAAAEAKAKAEAEAAERAAAESEAEAAERAKKNAERPKTDSPGGWARRLGKVITEKVLGKKVTRSSPVHLAAAQLHGWDDHRHHAGGHMRLTQEQYEKALKAAERPVKCDDGKFHYVPCPDALSKHHPHKVSFKAAKIGEQEK